MNNDLGKGEWVRWYYLSHCIMSYHITSDQIRSYLLLLRAISWDGEYVRGELTHQCQRDLLKIKLDMNDDNMIFESDGGGTSSSSSSSSSSISSSSEMSGSVNSRSNLLSSSMDDSKLYVEVRTHSLLTSSTTPLLTSSTTPLLLHLLLHC